MALTGGRLVVAGTADAVMKGERAFAEWTVPTDTLTSFSDVLDADDCAAIDGEAYRRARTWYRAEGTGIDPTEIDGASLGRAYELRATAMLVACLRARLVLTRLIGRTHGVSVEIRGAGEEWAIAARGLGHSIAEGSRIGRSLAAIVPDSGVLGPSRLGRVLTAARRFTAPASVDLVLSESPRWAAAYHDVLLGRWPAIAVNPGPRLQLNAIAHRWRLGSTWLADTAHDAHARSVVDLAESSDPDDESLRSSFIADLPQLAGWATLGRSFGARVAVAAQDVTPAARSVLLGFQAGGGRVITLEHGLSGGYTEQVHSVADHLAAWGPVQAAYHRDAGPSSIDVVEVGWPRLQAAVARNQEQADPRVDIAFFDQPPTPLSAGSWPEDALTNHAIVERYAERHPSRQVAVKLHPASSFYHAKAVAHDRAVVVSGDSLSLIRNARIVAAATSTTALEAMAIGRPVIRLVNRGYIGPVDFLRDSGALVSAGDAEAFEAAVELLLSDRSAYRQAVESGRAYASAFVIGLDQPGSAEARLVGLVEGLVGQ
jgi:hypothetical protein